MKPEALYAFLKEQLEMMSVGIIVSDPGGEVLSRKEFDSIPNKARSFMSAMNERAVEYERGSNSTLGYQYVADALQYTNNVNVYPFRAAADVSPADAIRHMVIFGRMILAEAKDYHDVYSKNLYPGGKQVLRPDWEGFETWLNVVENMFAFEYYTKYQRLMRVINLAMLDVRDSVSLVNEDLLSSVASCSDSVLFPNMNPPDLNEIMEVITEIYFRYAIHLNDRNTKAIEEILNAESVDLRVGRFKVLLDNCYRAYAESADSKEKRFAECCGEWLQKLEVFEMSIEDVYPLFRKFINGNILARTHGGADSALAAEVWGFHKCFGNADGTDLLST